MPCRNTSKQLVLIGVISLLSLICSTICLAKDTPAATRKVTTVAGGYLGNGKVATAASLAGPTHIARDANGNLYIADGNNCVIRKVSTKGIISGFAGTGICGFGGDGGPAKAAILNAPTGLAFDSQGNLFVADWGNERVRKITAKGTISTVAGNGTVGYGGDGGPAIQAMLSAPVDVSVESGNLYIAETNNHVIRMVDGAGIIHTVAGNHIPGFSGDGGPATAAQLSGPMGVLADSQGNFYISDTNNNRVRKVDANGIITTYAGDGHSGNGGNGGPATQADIGRNEGLCLGQGKLFIAAVSNVWAVDLSTQNIAIVAGIPSGTPGFNGDGRPALSTELSNSWGLALDGDGNLLIVDSLNGRVRKVDASQTVTTIAGGFIGDDGPATASSLGVLSFMAGHTGFDPKGNLLIADVSNNRIRKVSAAGVITTVAGMGLSGYSGDGGPATSAMLDTPRAAVADGFGNVYISDGYPWSTGVIRRVDASGTITTFSNTAASGLAVDLAGNLYAADLYDNVVWKITPDGVAVVVAGVIGQCCYNGDGIPATQAFLGVPASVAVDQAGNLYIADYENNRIRMVDKNGIISTVAGNGTFGFGGDGGQAKQAMLAFPIDVGVDTKGNLYIADSLNGRIRIVDGAGTINTYAGTGSYGYNGNGLAASATNIFPSAVSVSSKNVVYVSDTASQRVRKIH